MKRLLILSLCPILLLTACKIELSGPVHDVPWFTTHAAERAQTLASCKADPGNLRKNPNCINAQQADDKKALDPNNMNTPKF